MLADFGSALVYRYYSYLRILYLHVRTYLMFPKRDTFTLVKLVKTFTAYFPFYQNLGNLTRK